MGGISGFVRDFTGSTGAKAASRAGALQQQAFLQGIPGAQQATQTAIEGQQPFQQAGLDALSQQRALLGLGTPEEQLQAQQAIQETPGQRFIRERQERALVRNSAATGGLGGGNIKTALQEQAAGFAQQDVNNQFNRLGSLTDPGFQAATNIGNFGIGGEQTVSNLRTQGASAQASGLLGAAQSRAQGAQNTFEAVKEIGKGIASSDRRIKEDIKDLSNEDCYNAVMNLDLKVWRYMESAGLDRNLHIGPMAQDVPKEIQVETDGVLGIDIHDELVLVMGAIKHMRQQ